MRLPRRTLSWAALTASCAIVWIALLEPLSRPCIRMDGHGYYTTLATALFDRDFDLANEMAHTDNHNRKRWYTSPKDGRFINPFPVGAAVLWSPVVAVSYALDPARPKYGDPDRWRGSSPAFAPRYVNTIAIATAMEAMAGFVILLLGWRRYASRTARWTGAGAAALGTPLVYYALADPSYAHTASFLASALLLAAALSPRRDAWAFARLGLCWGLVALVRYQDAVLGVIAAPHLIGAAVEAWKRRSWRPAAHVALFFLVAVAVVAPQFFYWQRVFGESLLTALPIAMDWTRPHLVEFLFSTWDSAFVWSPVFLLGAVGLAFVRDRGQRWSLLAAVLLQVYVCAAVADWWGSASFGARRLVAVAPIVGLGIAHGIDRFVGSRRRLVLATAAVAIATLWNVRLAHYTVAGWFPENVRNVTAFARDHPLGHPYRQPWGLWDYPRLAVEIASAERRMWR